MSTRSNRSSPVYEPIDPSSNYMQPLPPNDGPEELTSMTSPTSTTRSEVFESWASPASGSPANGTRQAPNRLLPPESSEKSEKFMSFSTFCFIVGVAAIVIITIFSVLTVGRNIESSLNEKYSSLKTLHVQSKEELLEAINRGGCNVTADLIVKSSGTCYCLYMKQMSWNSAREFCLSKGKVYLAEILKKEDNDFLIPYLQNGETKQGVWLGASSLSGEWRWNYSGRQLELFEPSQWDVGQPSAFSPEGFREHCLEVFNWTSSIYKWNDISCSYTKPFLCSSKESDCCC